jgi:hypothetical protein
MHVLCDAISFYGVYSVPIDPERLWQFLNLGKTRRRNPDRLGERGNSKFAMWLHETVGFAVEAPNQESLQNLVKRVKFGPLVSRLILGIHAAVVSNRRIFVDLKDKGISVCLWGPFKCPQNWRAQVHDAFETLRLLHCLEERDDGGWNIDLLLKSAERFEDGYRVQVTKMMLGGLGGMVSESGDLEITARHIPPEARVTSAEIKRVEEGTSFAKLALTENVVDLIRERRRRDARKPSLQTLGWEGALYPLFLPAVLGEPKICQAVGRITRLLFREKTRNKPVEMAMVPGWSGKGFVRCPLLDPELSYTAFAANAGSGRTAGSKFHTNRRGRGYRIATWARRLGEKISGFLDVLNKASPVLGLVPAALDAEGKWYDLNQIIECGPEIQARLNLRIYTLDDFVTRWCQAFRWNPAPNSAQAAANPDSADELIELHSIASRLGIRQVAREMGIDSSNLSKTLKGKRKARPEFLGKIRLHLRGAISCDGKGPGTMSYNQKSWMVGG